MRFDQTTWDRVEVGDVLVTETEDSSRHGACAIILSRGIRRTGGIEMNLLISGPRGPRVATWVLDGPARLLGYGYVIKRDQTLTAAKRRCAPANSTGDGR